MKKNLFLILLLAFQSVLFSQDPIPAKLPAPQSADYGKIVVKEGKYGMVKANGKIVIPFEYDEIEMITNSLIKVRIDNKFGVLNYTNEVVIPVENQSLKKLSYNRILIRKNNKEGISDYQGKVIINPVFTKIQKSSIHKHYKLFKENKVGLADYYGAIILTPKYHSIADRITSEDKEVKFIVQLDNKYGIVNLKDSILVPFEYHQITHSKKTKTYVVKNENNKCGLLDIDFRHILPFDYDDIYAVTLNHFIVKNNGLYGVVDSLNTTVIPIKNDKVSSTIIEKDCQDIQTTAKLDGKVFLWTNSNKYSTKSYDAIIPAEQCLLKTKLKNTQEYIKKYGVIDKSGKTILEPIFDRVRIMRHSNSIITLKDKKYSLYNTDGKLLTDQQFESIRFINSLNYFAFTDNSKQGLLNLDGKVVVKPSYDKILFKNNSTEKEIYGLLNNVKSIVMEEK